MIQTALTIKRLAVTSAPWRIVPADSSAEAKTRAAFVEQAFRRMEGSPLSILNAAMDAFVKGWSVQEMVYREEGGRLWLAATRAKDPAHFGLVTDPFGAVTGLTFQLPGEDLQELPRYKFAIFVNRPSYQRPKGRSDLDAAYRHWTAKKALLNAWRAHLERFASPTVLGKFERGIPTEEQTAFLGALQNLHDNTALVYPNEIEVGLLQAGSASGTSFLDAIEFHNREMARSIVGQTLTTDEGRRVGSLALGKVHLQVLLLQIVAIRRELADLVMTEQVIRPLVEMNFGPGLVPRFEFEDTPLEAFQTGRL